MLRAVFCELINLDYIDNEEQKFGCYDAATSTIFVRHADGRVFRVKLLRTVLNQDPNPDIHEIFHLMEDTDPPGISLDRISINSIAILKLKETKNPLEGIDKVSTAYGETQAKTKPEDQVLGTPECGIIISADKKSVTITTQGTSLVVSENGTVSVSGSLALEGSMTKKGVMTETPLGFIPSCVALPNSKDAPDFTLISRYAGIAKSVNEAISVLKEIA